MSPATSANSTSVLNCSGKFHTWNISRQCVWVGFNSLSSMQFT